MLQFSELTVNLDATPRPVGNVTVPEAVARPMIDGLRRMLLAHDDGRAFAVDVSFALGRPLDLAIQRIGASACAAEWSRHEQLLAVTLILSGLDAGDDDLAITTVAGAWGLALAEENWDAIWTYDRPVIVNVFLAPGSFSDVVIRGGIACLATAFGLLMGRGRRGDYPPESRQTNKSAAAFGRLIGRVPNTGRAGTGATLAAFDVVDREGAATAMGLRAAGWAFRSVLASVYQVAGREGLAVPLLEEALKRSKATHGAEHSETLKQMNNLAQGYLLAGNSARALPLCEDALVLLQAKLGPDHPSTLIGMSNLAWAYEDAGRLDRAIAIGEDALSRCKRTLGVDHPGTLTEMNNLASSYLAAGKADRALPLVEDGYRRAKAKLGADHPQTLTIATVLANAYLQCGKLDLAIPLCQESLRLSTAKMGPEHPSTLTNMNNLARLYQETGKPELARPLLEKALQVGRAKLSAGHPSVQTWMGNLARVYLDLGKPELSRPLEDELLAIARKASPDANPKLAELLARVGWSHLRAGTFADAEPLLRECAAIQEQLMAFDAWQTFNVRSMLGGAMLGQGKYAEAEPLLLEGYNGMKGRERTMPASDGVRIVEALERLVALYERRGQDGDAATAAEYRAFLAGRKATPTKPAN